MRRAAEWSLRLGCGGVNLYAGFFLLTTPARFAKYVPSWFSQVPQALGVPVDVCLQVQGLGELIMALNLLGWSLPRWWVRGVTALFVVEMLSILLCVGVNGETFRNVGLLGAGVALWLTLSHDREEQAPACWRRRDSRATTSGAPESAATVDRGVSGGCVTPETPVQPPRLDRLPSPTPPSPQRPGSVSS